MNRTARSFVNRRLPLAVFVAVLGLAAVAPRPGAAVLRVAPGQAASSTVEESWALTPTGSDSSQPGSRSNLSYTLAPGATLDDSVTLWNYSDNPIAFDVYATDAYNTKSGEFTLLSAGEQPRDVGSWIRAGTSKITVPGKTSVQIPIVLTLPADATPGDHTGGIVATSKTPAIDGSGNQVLLDRRVGTRVYLRVDGALRPRLEVEQISTSYHDSLNPLAGSVDVAYRVRNTGNVRLSAKQRVAVDDLFGTAASRRLPDLQELLPGNAVTVRTRLDDVAATVRISSEVTLRPVSATGAVDASSLHVVSRSGDAWAIPWTLLGLVAVLLMTAWAIAWWRRRRAAPTRSRLAPAPS